MNDELLSPDRQRQLISALGVLNELLSSAAFDDLDAFLTTLDYADAIGPVVEPTLYRAALAQPGRRPSIALLRELASYRRRVLALREKFPHEPTVSDEEPADTPERREVRR